MEESKELQGVYKIFRTAIYVSLLIEFFMYAIDPEVLDYLNGVVCDDYSLSVIIGRTLCACHLGVSCIVPLPVEYNHALAVSCPATSVEVQYQHSLALSGIGIPPHCSIYGDVLADS